MRAAISLLSCLSFVTLLLTSRLLLLASPRLGFRTGSYFPSFIARLVALSAGNDRGKLRGSSAAYSVRDGLKAPTRSAASLSFVNVYLSRHFAFSLLLTLLGGGAFSAGKFGIGDSPP